ncbi:MAG: tetratricopeptide repeat protein [Williamsia sp.]|nr:tetratricopeptide repeat protein [Williamsia sp.]
MRIFLQKLAGLLLTLWLCSCHSPENNRASRSAVLHSQSFAQLTDSISRFPHEARLYLDRATLLTQQNFHEIATADYQHAWKLRPDEATALAYTSNLFLTGQEEAAIKLLHQCTQSFPANPEFARRLSEAYVQKGEIQKALTQYTLLLQNDSANFDAWYQKGLLQAQRKDTAGAISSFERAYQLQPLQLYGISLADLYAETGNPLALQLCDSLIGVDSLQRTTDALFIKGVYFSNTHQYEQALHQYESCIRRDWKFVEAYIEKGIILFNQQNIDEALNTFAVAAKIAVTYAPAYYWMGRCYEKIGKTDDAQESYERAITLNRDYPEAEEALRKLK